jgi:hypothetical protein
VLVLVSKLLGFVFQFVHLALEVFPVVVLALFNARV